MTADTRQAQSEITIERVKDAEHLKATYDALRARIKAGERPASSILSKAQRPFRAQALEALKAEGLYDGGG